VLKLLNKNVTEFDYIHYSAHKCGCCGPSVNSEFSERVMFKHLLENCPQVKKIVVTGKVWADCEFLLDRVRQEDLFRKISTSWENLNYMSVHQQDAIFLKLKDIKAIQESLPNLRLVVFCL